MLRNQRVHIIGEEVHKGLDGELLGEEAGEGMDVAALGEGGRDEPDAGEEEDERYDDENEVSDDVVGKPCRFDAAFLFHWNVSSLL